MQNNPIWLTQPLHLPFPFLPLPSLAAVLIADAFGIALFCWGLSWFPNRWPYTSRAWEPIFPAGSPVWAGMAALFTLAAGVGAWKLGQPGDLALACAWTLSGLLVVLLHARLSASTEEEPPQPFHPHELYHIRDAAPGAHYPLAASELLRLLHAARYGDTATRNSIHVRLQQAMMPDPAQREVDTEMCALDDCFLEWLQSGTRPTPALAEGFLRLLQRKRGDDATTSFV